MNARPSPATIVGSHARTPQASGSRGGAQHIQVRSAGPRPSLVSRRQASGQYGKPWKPAGSPDPIRAIPSNPSGSELTFSCFIAKLMLALAGGLTGAVAVTAPQ